MNGSYSTLRIVYVYILVLKTFLNSTIYILFFFLTFQTLETKVNKAGGDVTEWFVPPNLYNTLITNFIWYHSWILFLQNDFNVKATYAFKLWKFVFIIRLLVTDEDFYFWYLFVHILLFVPTILTLSYSAFYQATFHPVITLLMKTRPRCVH